MSAGVDLASKAEHTATCIIEWSNGQGHVINLSGHATDEDLVCLIESVQKLGIDVPLGWPRAFVQAVSMHARVGGWPVDYDHADLRHYRYRQTDLWLRDELGSRPPLSVSTDLIAVPAMRAAAVLSRLNSPVALDGSGVVVEVYPAAALRRWGFASTRYKGPKNADNRKALVNGFMVESSRWLHMKADFLNLCYTNDNVFDSLIAAVVARAAAMHLVEAIPPDCLAEARQEGWIALPQPGSFHQLAASSVAPPEPRTASTPN